MNKLFTLALVLLISISIAQAGLFSVEDKTTEKIDAMFPELVYNTESCITDCEAKFKYCLDGDATYELNFNIPQVTSYGYYTTELKTEPDYDKCVKEETLTHKCSEKELDNGTKDCDYDYTNCIEYGEKEYSYEQWHEGLPSEKAGCYEVTVFGHKQADENVDWQPTIVKKGFLWDTAYTQDKWAWWNTTYSAKKCWNNTATTTRSREPANLNLTALTFTSNCTWGTRLTWCNESTCAYESEIAYRKVTSGADYCFVTVYQNVTTANQNDTYCIYYKASTETAPTITTNLPMFLNETFDGYTNYTQPDKTTDWNYTSGMWSYWTDGANGTVYMNGTAGDSLVNLKYNLSSPLEFRFDMRAGGTQWYGGIYDKDTKATLYNVAPDYYDMYEIDASPRTQWGRYDDNPYFANASASTTCLPQNSWIKFKMIQNSTGHFPYYYCAGSWYSQGTNADSTYTYGYVGFKGYNGMALFFDNMKATTGTFYDTDSTVYPLGAEESFNSIIFSTQLPANNTVINNTLSLNLNFTPQSVTSAVMNCTWKLNGTLINYNETTYNNTATNYLKTGLSFSYYNWTVTCTNGTTTNTSTYVFTLNNTEAITIGAVSPANNSVINDTNSFGYNFTPLSKIVSPMNCTLKLNGTLKGYNESSLNNTLTNFALTSLPYSYYNTTVNCSNNLSSSQVINFFYMNDTGVPVTTATAVGNISGLAYVWGSTSFEGLNITLTCNDGTGSGCNYTRYCIDDLDACSPNTTYTGVIVSNTLGTHYIRYASNDSFGNQEATLSSNYIITSGSQASLSYLSVNVTGDTYTNSSNTSNNYGTNTTMNATFTAQLSYLWLDATSLFGSGHKIYALFFNYTISNHSGTYGGEWDYCTAGESYSAQDELTLTYINNLTICTNWASLLSIPSSDGFKTVELSNYNYLNATNLQRVMRGATANTSNSFLFYTKEYGVENAKPKLVGLYAGNGNIFVNSASDESTGVSITSNVTFTNTTNTITFNSVGTTSYGTGNFSYVSANQMNGLVTTTVKDVAGLYYPSYFYNWLYNTSSPVEIYPALVNMTSSNIGTPTFYVVNPAGVPVTNAVLNIYTNQNGTWVLSKQGLTDSSGAITMYLYNNVQYRVTATDGTTTSIIYTITPTLPSYSIILGISGSNPTPNIMDSISWKITPLTYQIPYSNNTTVTFYVYDSEGEINFIKMWLSYGNDTSITNVSSSSAHGSTLIGYVNTTNTSLIKGIFEINRIGFDDYNITRNFMVRNYANYSYSLSNILNAFKNESSISDGWKQIIVFGLAIGCAIAVFKFAGDMGALLTFAVVMTVAVLFGWIGWVIVMLIWLLVVGYAFMRGGMF